MGTEDARNKPGDVEQTRGEQLDEAVEKVGATLEDKASNVGDKVAEKVIDKTGGLPD
jgi:hypothetical protein